MSKVTFVRLFLVSATLLLSALHAPAQLNRGTFTGTVRDSQDAVIPGAAITIRNQGTNATYKTGTTGVGQYTMANLPVGTYELTFEADGFKKLIRNGIELKATEVLRVDAVLEVGSLSDSVRVTAEAPILQSETPEVGVSLVSKDFMNLPLTFNNTRQPDDFAFKLSPGVSGGSYSSNILGSTAFSKETLLDGASVTVYRSGDFSQMATSLEALAEFKIQTSGVSAEFGRTQAGVFNYIMKSGANELHGSAYGGLRNEALNANTFPNKARGVARAQDRKQNFAGSFGGPVYIPKVYNGRDRTFFYATYERFRMRTLGFRAPDRTVPLPEFYEGDLSRLLGANTGQNDALGRPVARGAIYDPASFRQLANGRWVGDIFPGNRIPVARFSQISRNLNAIAVKSYLPTARDASGQIPLVANATFPASSTPSFDQHQFSVKMDQMISSAHKISGSYSYNKRPRTLLDQGGMWDLNEPDGGVLSKARTQPLFSHLIRTAWDWTVSPRLLNHMMLYGNRLVNPNNTVHTDIDGGKLLGIKNFSTIGVPQINWGGGPLVTLQSPGDPQYSFLGSTGWGFLDSVSLSKGRHFLKIGADLRGSHLNSRSGPGGAFNFNALATAIPGEAFSGNLTGHSFASYLLGIVHNGSLSNPVGLGGRRYYYAGYIQDDFKVSRNLTLNIGLRWEFQPPSTEVADRMASWSETKVDPATGLPGAYEWTGKCQACNGKRYFGRRDWNDWGPRIGFAWQPFGKWTLRGAYGVMYEADSFNGLFGVVPAGLGGAYSGTYNLTSDPIQPWRGIFNWDSGFPTDRFTPASFNPSWGNANSPYTVDPNYGHSPYVQSWNFNVQRELPGRWVVDAGYIGRKGTGLREGKLRMLNQLPVSALEQYGRNLNNPVRSAAEAAANGVRYPFQGFNGTVASALRQYPQVRGNATIGSYGSPLGFSSYNSLQVTVNRQFSRGLTAYANYVWSKSISNIESSDPNGNSGRPLDYYNLALEKSVSDQDIPHALKASIQYVLPEPRGSKWMKTVLGGWTVSSILNYNSGTPLGFGGSFPLATGWNGAVNRANVAAGDLKVSNFDKSKFELSTLGSPNNTYLVKSQFSDPKPLTLGTAAFRYSQVRNFGTINEDFGLLKNHRFGEKFRFQLRAEFLNAFNRHQITGINTSITSVNFGQVTNVSGNRTIQVGTRLDF